MNHLRAGLLEALELFDRQVSASWGLLYRPGGREMCGGDNELVSRARDCRSRLLRFSYT